MPVKIQFEAQLPVIFKQEKKYMIASCPILDVMTQGKDKEEAKQKLNDALYLFFVSCYEHGTLDEVLKQCGFSSAEVPQTTTVSDQEIIDIQIPFFRTEENAAQCLPA